MKIGDMRILLTMCIPLLLISGCANSTSQAVKLVKAACESTDWPSSASVDQALKEWQDAPVSDLSLLVEFTDDGRVREFTANGLVKRRATAKELRAREIYEKERGLLEVYKSELRNYYEEVATSYESNLKGLAKAARLNPAWDDILTSTITIKNYYENRPLAVDGYVLTAEEKAQLKKADAAYDAREAACLKASS